jgi:hypothetical protein
LPTAGVKVEIAGHAADHGELLPVLFAEQGHVGADLVEQLADHGGDAIEMTGPAAPHSPSLTPETEMLVA